MKTFFAAVALLSAAAFTGWHLDCPPVFEIGQSYHEVQTGPCPDIDSVATFITPDSTHSGYYCRSKNVMVVGDRRTAKVDGFFLWNGA